MPSLADYGIRLRSTQPGNHGTTCPQCSHQRQAQHQKLPCLSVKVEPDGGATWNCKNCDWSGGFRSGLPAVIEPPRRKVVRPVYQRPAPQSKELDYVLGRGIAREVIERYQLGLGEGQVQFPYLVGGEVVNVKHRTLDKRFWLERDAELVFYGLDDVAGKEAFWIVEGEFDKLACATAGVSEVLSVPAGGVKEVSDEPWRNREKFLFLDHAADLLAQARKVVLAVDNDEVGRNLQHELARRIGRGKCWTVTWPEGCKDANDVLLRLGADVLADCLHDHQPYPIRGVYRVQDFRAQVLRAYEGGQDELVSTGWVTLDPLFKVRPGEVTVLTGLTNSGKSEFIDAILVNVVRQTGWAVAYCSMENSPGEDHIPKLMEKLVMQPFWRGWNTRMTPDQLDEALAWANNHFHFIVADDDLPTIDWVLEMAGTLVMRYGIRFMVIDPYNFIVRQDAGNKSETEYISEMLTKVKQFAKRTRCHVIFVAHPTKAPNGERPTAPSVNSIAGSAHWGNKADNVLAVHRNWEDLKDPDVEIHVRKVRSKIVGRPGMVKLRYKKITGTYEEIAP